MLSLAAWHDVYTLGLQEDTTVAVDPEAAVKDKWDYSRHHLEFVTACPDHQIPVIVENPLLERPARTDEEEQDAPVELPPVTMKMLDENIPTMHVPCTLDEPRFKYLNDFPAIGAYFAAATKQNSGCFSSILAADTLVPHGSGQPISTDDRDLIWELARAIATRLERCPADRIRARMQESKYPSVDEIRDEMKKLRLGDASGADGGAEEAPAEEEAADADPGEAEGETGDAEDDGIEEAEIDPDAELAEKAAHFGKLV